MSLISRKLSMASGSRNSTGTARRRGLGLVVAAIAADDPAAVGDAGMMADISAGDAAGSSGNWLQMASRRLSNDKGL